MKYRSLFRILLMALLVAAAPSLSAQSLVQLGYFPFNGIFSITGYDHYMLTGAGHVVDVTNPYSPQLVGNVSIGLGSAVVVEGQYGYFGTGMVASVKIVDLSVPSAPITMGTVSLGASSGVYGLAVDGNVLYAANAYQGLASIDISNPLAPTLIQQLPLSNAQQARGVAVLGDHAYVADGSGLLIVDISDPADMQVIGGLGEGYVSVAINEDGTRLAVGQSSGGAIVFDLANPVLPQVIYGVPESNGPAYTVQMKEGLLYVSSEQFGVRVYSMGVTSATLVGSFDNSSNGQSFAAYALGDLVLVAGLVNGAAVLGWGNVGVETAPSITDAINCYPIPARDIVRWDVPERLSFDRVVVIDITGRTVLTERAMNSSITIGSLAQGRYVLTLLNGAVEVARGVIIKEH